MTISPDGSGGFIAGGLPDGSTQHVAAKNCTVIVKVTDEFANVLGELEFLIPYAEVSSLTVAQLGHRYGEPYFTCLQGLVKHKIPPATDDKE